MRYEKTETVLRIALDMQGSALGVSLEDIQRRYADKALSRRTAERLRDAVERLFPQIERANPGEVPKRWRLPGGAVGGLAFVTADELADLTTRKRGFSIQQYAEASFGVFHEDPVDVVWRFSPKVASDAAEFLFHPYQVMEPQPDGSLIVRFRAGGLLEMSWHLFTWGDGVEIVKPRRLASLLERQCRDQLRRRGRKANAAG
jgi:WYL domain